jgi:hypothetical protein
MIPRSFFCPYALGEPTYAFDVQTKTFFRYAIGEYAVNNVSEDAFKFWATRDTTSNAFVYRGVPYPDYDAVRLECPTHNDCI